MQYRVYDRQTIAYVDGGFVASYEIDDDYIVNNNTVVSIISPTRAMVGDIIVLIKTSGVYHKGVITEIDNSALKISYKSDKELFNDKFPNPFSAAFLDDTGAVENPVAGKFGISIVAEIIQLLYAETRDPFKKLPLTITTKGDVLDSNDQVRMLWTWQDNSIGMVDWLVDLFEKYNVVLSWTIDFDTSIENPAERTAKYIVTLSAVANEGGLIKDNVAMQTITYTGEQTFDQTVCVLVDSESKSILDNDGTWYLYETTDQDYRIMPVPEGSLDISESVAIPDETFEDKTCIVSLDLGYNIDGYTVSVVKFTKVGTSAQTATVTSCEAVGTVIKLTLALSDAKPVGLKYDVELNLNNTFVAQRVLPVKTKFVEYNESSSDVTPQNTAAETLIPSKYNQAVEVKINADSHMFEFATAQFGNEYTIVGKYVQELGDQEMQVVSIYTGRKESSKSKYVTLLFGLGRKQYTDLMQIRLRKQRYSSVYGG